MDSEKEKNAFSELKKRMEGEMEEDLYEDDNMFHRFLRARDLNVDAAEAMLRKHVEWRKQHDLKNISEYKSPQVLEKYVPLNFLGYTKEGEVLRYIAGGNIDFRGVMACCSTEEFEKHIIKIYEEDLQLLKKQREKLGKCVDKVVYIQDLKGATLSKMTDRVVLQLQGKIQNMYQENYPEMLKTIYGINAPKLVGFMYTLLKILLPRRILERMKIYSDDSWRKDLLEIIDPETLPAFLGGERTDPDGNPLCNTFLNHAGKVPDEFFPEKRPSFSTLPDVQKIAVPKGSVHEIPVEIEEADTVIEWEFKVKSGDIMFGLKYQDGEENKTEVVPLQKMSPNEDTETGLHQCENVGTYIIVFDNSSTKSKDIFFKLQVLSPGDAKRFFEEKISATEG